MGMNMGWCDVTLSGGTGTGTWQHPAQIEAGANAETVELDGVPEFFFATITNVIGGAVGVHEFTFTATGVTVTSTHAGDSSTVRVFAMLRVPPQWWQI